jgi:drug/metabolite transporter (DMT)-like permease
MAAVPRMTAQEWVLLLFLSFLWGGSFFLSAVAIKEIAPFTLAFARMALAALALAAVAFATGLRFPKDAASWGAYFIMGAVMSAVPFSLIYYGQTQISGGLASILNATTPLFALVFAHIFTHDEKITVQRFSGVLAGLGGVILIMGPAALAESGTRVAAQTAVLGAAMCYGVASIYGKRFRDASAVVTACGQLTAGAAFLLPMAAVADHPLSRPLPGLVSLACVVALALFSTALAFIVYFRILRRAGATNVTLVTLLVPVSAILLGALILGETLAPRHFGGLALIACGLVIIDGRVPGLIFRRRRAVDAGPAAPPVVDTAQDLPS